jgi:hypothetical protein
MVVSMLAAGCSPGLSRVRVGLGPGGVHLATAARPPQDRSAAAREASPADLQAAATRIPVGAKVRVRMRSGPELKGILRAAGSTGIVVQKPAPKDATKTATKTATAAGAAAAGGPRPATAGEVVEVPYEAMRSIQRDTSMGTGMKAALIAAGIAVAGLVIYQAQKGPGPESAPGGG